jgi:poly(hydroxyalkanoate) depolymerase family esterase
MRILAASSVALALVATPALAAAGTVTTETHQGHTVRVFTPSAASPKALVVMLHGCTQTADGFADATQMEALAEAEGFVVAFPQQLDTALQRCWQWWDPAHQKRGTGEPAAIAGTIDEIVQAKGLDPDRVYVAGISAGAAMTVILGVTYPDRIAAIGVVAGLEYGAASSAGDVISAAAGGGPDPKAQGDAAFAAMGDLARVVPALVFHGTSDGVVAKVNGDQVAAQWLEVDARVLGDGAIAPPVTTPGSAGYTYTLTAHRTVAENAPVVEEVVVDGLGHAWPGGRAGGSYADPKGPDATKLLWSFFAPRTKTAPLFADPDDGTGAAAADGGAEPLPPPASTSSSGGCTAARSPGATPLAIAVVVAIAASAAARRRRARPLV